MRRSPSRLLLVKGPAPSRTRHGRHHWHLDSGHVGGHRHDTLLLLDGDGDAILEVVIGAAVRDEDVAARTDGEEQCEEAEDQQEVSKHAKHLEAVYVTASVAP